MSEKPQVLAEDGPSETVSWRREPFNRFLDHMREAHDLHVLTVRGIDSLSRHASLVEALANLDAVGRADPDWRADEDPEVQEARNIAAMAAAEVANEFPLVNAYSVVGMWGALEALFDDVLMAWLSHKPELLTEEPLGRVKLPVEVLVLPEEERTRKIVDEYLRNVGADLKRGSSRFERILSIIGLDGPVDEAMGKTLFEMQQVRNLYAHRRGVVDAKFATDCPWLSLGVGERCRINHETYRRYDNAVYDYVVVVVNRLLVKDGKPPIDPKRVTH